jgi:hypothetical protein
MLFGNGNNQVIFFWVIKNEYLTFELTLNRKEVYSNVSC